MKKSELMQEINEAMNTARGLGLGLTVSEYAELERIDRNTAQLNAFWCKDYKGVYTVLAFETFGYYGVVVVAYENASGNIFYMDEQLHYTYIKDTAEAVYAMLEKCERSIFSFDELVKPLKNYKDYRARRDFTINALRKIFGGVSAFYIGKPDAEQEAAAKSGFFCWHTFSYYQTAETVAKIKQLVETLERLHAEQIKINIEYFSEAYEYEAYNFECGISDRWDEVLDHIGIKESALTDEQNNRIYAIQRKVYAHSW